MAKTQKAKKCGIVMPISEIDNVGEDHWAEVKDLIVRAAEKADYDAELVSSDSDVGVIQKRIVRNLYECPVIVCDVSCKNPNVMLELGMRLAFDKPVVLIKDEETPFSFDTSPLEHLVYPRSLRFSVMEAFIEKLSDKIRKAASQVGEDSFLKSFGAFKIADLEVENVPAQEAILNELAELRSMLTSPSHSRSVGLPAALFQLNKLRQVGPDTYSFVVNAENSDAVDFLNKVKSRPDIRVMDEKIFGSRVELEINPRRREREKIVDSIQNELRELIPF